MKKLFANVIVSCCLLSALTVCNAGLFSSDPINIPRDRFYGENGAAQTGVPLDTEYIIHGGDAGCFAQNKWPQYWNESESPKFVEFYLKLVNGKWQSVSKEQANLIIQNENTVERLIFIFLPTEIRSASKIQTTSGLGNKRMAISSRSAGVIRYEADYSYVMNRRFEDNLVSLYTDRGCIAQSDSMSVSNFAYMQCGCKTSSANRTKYGYSFCTSQFNRDGEINTEAIQNAIKDAGGLASAISASNQVNYNGSDSVFLVAENISNKIEYHNLFESATTMSLIQRFMDKYRSNDPELLIPKLYSRVSELQRVEYRKAFEAAAKLESIPQLNDFIDKYSVNDPELLIPKARNIIQNINFRAENAKIEKVKLEKIQAKEDAAREKRELALQEENRRQIASFRKTLTEGAETNCGPVIEVKSKLVKIAFPVSGYGNEHWIRREVIYPPGYGCRFLNGQYRSPE